jgi:hypothetical protein
MAKSTGDLPKQLDELELRQRRGANFDLPGRQCDDRHPRGIRAAVREDLASGAYQQAAREAVAGDPDLVQE